MAARPPRDPRLRPYVERLWATSGATAGAGERMLPSERFRLIDPSDGRVGHAELEFGPTMVLMLSDEYPEMGIRGAAERGASMGVHLHVDDCDAVVERAVAAGAELRRPPSDQFYGERSANIVDPWGCEWLIGHSLEQVEPAEIQRRWDAMRR